MRRTSMAGIAVLSIVASVLVSSAPAQAAGWNGFAVSTAPSGTGRADSPSWGLGVTTDLGGPLGDVWNNNHGNMSEALIDLAGASPRTRTAAQSGAPAVDGPDTHGVAFSDIDGDGDEDLFEVTGRNNDNRLFRNDNGTLVHTGAGNLADFFGRGRQPLFLDFDLDGDMDVIVTNLDLRSDPVPQNERQLKPSELYLNNGSGTSWTKVADPAEIMSDGHIRIASLTSTGPGTAPIVVTHDVFNLAKDSIRTGSSSLAEPAVGAIPRTSSALPIREVLVGDFDGDLHPEFIAIHGSENATSGQWPIKAYEVTSAGAARQVTIPVDPLVDNCRSGAAADFDNDGDLDILAGCAQRQQGQNRNVVLLNDGVGNFSIGGTNLLPATIAETPGAIVTGDLDADGWVDAFVANGYDFDNAPDHVLTNRGGSGHWLQIELIGSNPDAMGAQVFVGTDDWQVRETGHRYHRSQDARTLHFGLGAATRVARVEVAWPDGTFSTCSVSGIDRRVTVRKDSAACNSRNRAGFTNTITSAPVTVPGQPPPPRCAGRIVTVDMSRGQVPTQGDDVILGTSGANTINALGGDDVICGLGGDDIINGGAGLDRIYGQGGNDIIDGADGRDRIWGGEGHDVINGGRNRDVIVGNRGRDVINGESGRDRLLGSVGNDIVRGGGGNDSLKGGKGIDSADGGSGRDSCTDFASSKRCE